MRITLNVPDDLMKDAIKFSGIKSKTEVINAALTFMVQREASRRLAALGGTMPWLKSVHRRRMPKSK